MKVYVFPADTGGCGYYRLIWPALALKAQGHDVKVIHPKHPDRVVGMTDDMNKLVSVGAPKDADVLVFQRVASRIMEQAIPIWRANGIAVVIDIDDDMSAIHPSNPAWTQLHPTTEGRVAEYDWHAAQRMTELATYVTVSSEALIRKYAHHGRGTVLHNRVPEATLNIKHTDTPNLFGWGGTVRTHPNDPEVLGPMVMNLQNGGYTFRVVGPSQMVSKYFITAYAPECTGGVSIDRWFHELAKLGVGIAPLADTKFNAAKSWLKMLEYAAVGVPCVGSPRVEYQRLHRMGIGLLAQAPKNWRRHVQTLLKDESMRREMSERGRDIVRAHLTIEANAWRWMEAWTEALRIQRGGTQSPFKRPVLSTTATNERGPQTS